MFLDTDCDRCLFYLLRCIYLDDQLNDLLFFFPIQIDAKFNAITCTPLYTCVRYSIISIYFHFTWLDRCSWYLLTINHVYSRSSIWKWWPHLAQITISSLFILFTNGIIGGISWYIYHYYIIHEKDRISLESLDRCITIFRWITISS